MLISLYPVNHTNTLNNTKKDQVQRYTSVPDSFQLSNLQFTGNNASRPIHPDFVKKMETDIEEYLLSGEMNKDSVKQYYTENKDPKYRDESWKIIKELANKNEELKSKVIQFLDLTLLLNEKHGGQQSDTNVEDQANALNLLGEIAPPGSLGRIGARYVNDPNLFFVAGKFIETLSGNSDNELSKDGKLDVLYSLARSLKTLLKSKTYQNLDKEVVRIMKKNTLLLLAKIGKGDPDTVLFIEPYVNDESLRDMTSRTFNETEKEYNERIAETKALALRALGETELKSDKRIIDLVRNNLSNNGSRDVNIAALRTLKLIAQKEDVDVDLVSKIVPLLQIDKEKEQVSIKDENGEIQNETLDTLKVVGEGDIKLTTRALLNFMKDIYEIKKGALWSGKIDKAFKTLNEVDHTIADQFIKHILIAEQESFEQNRKYMLNKTDSTKNTETVDDPKQRIIDNVEPVWEELIEGQDTDGKLKLFNEVTKDLKVRCSQYITKAINRTLKQIPESLNLPDNQTT